MRVCILVVIVGVAAATHERVLLKDVQVLTLRNGVFTTGRRYSPIPQLVCQNCATNEERNLIDSMQCLNVGSDGRDVNWKCEAQLDKHRYKLGRTEVSCEGFASPDDPFILAGSCAVEYHLERVHKTEPRVVETITTTTTTIDHVAIVMVVVFVLFIIALMYVVCITTPSHVDRIYPAPMPPPPVVYPSVVYQAPPVQYTTPIYCSAPSPVVHQRVPRTVVRERSPSPDKQPSVSYATTKRR